MEMYQHPTDQLIDTYIECVGDQLDLMENFYLNPTSDFDDSLDDLLQAHWAMRVKIKQRYRTMRNINEELESRGVSKKQVFWCHAYLYMTEV